MLPPVQEVEGLKLDPVKKGDAELLPAVKKVPKKAKPKCDFAIDPRKKPTIEVLECKMEENRTRCFNPISGAECKQLNENAVTQNFVDPSVGKQATDAGICIITAPFVGIASVCPQGCFEASTNILVQGTSGAFQEMLAKDIGKDHRLAALDKDSDLDNPRLVSKDVARLTSGAEKHDLFRFKLDNGRTLQVTEFHGMVLSDGRVMHAEDVQASDTFISRSGEEVGIVSIDRVPTNLDVYNFELDVEKAEEHVIVAEDILIGDLFWQSPKSVESYSKKLR